MDPFAHGLWGGAAFGQEEHRWKWAFLWGFCPDLFPFGPYFLASLGNFSARWELLHSGPLNQPMIPAYVHQAYNVTHSLVIFSVLAIVAWKLYGTRAWPFGAWGLHILCDIPTHSLQYSPTPYLWPLATPFFNGHNWDNGPFMLWNYAGLALVYLVLAWRKKHPAHVSEGT